jgi:hypothetical protein
MAIKLNKRAFEYAKELIKKDKIRVRRVGCVERASPQKRGRPFTWDDRRDA